MSKRHKKKRNKKYQEAAMEQPTVHRYSAEDESKKDRLKSWRRRLIGYGLLLGLAWLVVWLVWQLAA